MRAELPHGTPIRMVESVEKDGDSCCESQITIPMESPYLCNGFLCPEMLLECMAQCFGGAFEGKVRQGYLAAAKNFIVTGRPRAGDCIRVKCHLFARIGAIVVLSGAVDKVENGSITPLARAELKIYLQEDEL